MNEKKFGLIGYPLSHSFSKQYFTEKFQRENIKNAEYINFPIENIEEIVEVYDENLQGLNVTIPYKELVIEYIDELEDSAAAIGAVNCIKIKDGKKIGYNTDLFGFRESLKKLIGDRPVKALILGTGGASKAVSFALKQLKIDYTFVSRRKKMEWLTYSELNSTIMNEYQLIINTTPTGMFPNEEECPDIPYDMLTPNHILYDLLYNPAETTFMKKGSEKGATTKNGYEMLVLQAEKNWEIWNS